MREGRWGMLYSSVLLEGFREGRGRATNQPFGPLANQPLVVFVIPLSSHYWRHCRPVRRCYAAPL